MGGEWSVVLVGVMGDSKARPGFGSWISYYFFGQEKQIVMTELYLSSPSQAEPVGRLANFPNNIQIKRL